MPRILIVEDDEELRLVLTRALARAGYQVIEAKSGVEALKLLRVEPPDVVLTDIVLPDEDGIGLIMKIRTGYPDIPVLAMSGGVANSALYLDIARKLGARSILAKPFRAEQVLQALEEILPGTR